MKNTFEKEIRKNSNESKQVNSQQAKEFCLWLLRKDERECFTNLNSKDIIDNRKFWHTVKPFLSKTILGKHNLAKQ